VYNNVSNQKNLTFDDESIMLGIESSCDDTGVALLKYDGTVLSEILVSQIGVHEE